MKVVLDTNILVGACLGSKYANRLLYACFENQLTPMISTSLFCEYEDVINRDELFVRSALNKSERNQLLDDFLSICQWVQIYYLWRPNLKDESDNFIIELAIAGNADFIITNNIKDFKNSELLFKEIQIKSPQEIMEYLQ